MQLRRFEMLGSILALALAAGCSESTNTPRAATDEAPASASSADGSSDGEQAGKPTAADIEAAMNTIWAHPAGPATARTTVEINSAEIGAGRPATIEDRRDRPSLPPDALLTDVVIDFSVRTYEPARTLVTRRVRAAIVYQDHAGAWHVDTGQAVGADVDSEEPAEQ